MTKEYKERDYKNKQLVATEWKYLCNDVLDIYDNVGLGIIKFFDSDYKVIKNIAKLKKKYEIKYKNKKEIVIKENSPEQLLAVCSLGKVYKTKKLSWIEIEIAKKLKICDKIISTNDEYEGFHKCAICGDIVSKIASHLFNSHKDVNHQKYYDKYIKSADEGKCLVCGKKTKFLDMERGYLKCCSDKCSHFVTANKSVQTFISRYGVRNPAMAEEIKDKMAKTVKEKFGVNHVFKAKSVKDKIKETNIERYGYEVPTQNPEIQKKIAATVKKKYGCKCVFQADEIKEKSRQTSRMKYGYDYPQQDPAFQEIVKRNNLEKYGFDYPNQTPENRERASAQVRTSSNTRRKLFKGNLSNSETIFKELLQELEYKFKQEYSINGHNYDFAIFKKGKLDCLVEIDGEVYHGITSDAFGSNDWKRYENLPPNVKLVVVDSYKLEFGLREVMRVRDISYKEWKNEILESIPSKIKYPKYSDDYLHRTWNYLLERKNGIKYRWINNNVGKSIVIHFCPEYAYRKIDYNKAKKNLFMSPFSSKNYLDSMESLLNIPELILKYMKVKKDTIVVSKHSPEKMLAVCCLGKTYISQEPLDNGSKEIIKYFKLNAYGAIRR